MNTYIKEHVFGNGHTIEGVIKLYNQHDLDKNTIISLVDIFNRNNPTARPPRVGQMVKVPIFVSN